MKIVVVKHEVMPGMMCLDKHVCKEKKEKIEKLGEIERGNCCESVGLSS